MLPLLPPVRVELEAWGTTWGDVAFGPGDQILVSERLTRSFANAGLIGFERLDAVEIVKAVRRKVAAGKPPVYSLASIQRSRAILDDAASGLVRDQPPTCKECRIGGIIKRADRIVLQDSTWSGEDLFFARGLPGTILASERFRRLCEVEGLANCSLVDAVDFRFDHYPQERRAVLD
jgi:hypothetical protein